MSKASIADKSGNHLVDVQNFQVANTQDDSKRWPCSFSDSVFFPTHNFGETEVFVATSDGYEYRFVVAKTTNSKVEGFVFDRKKA